ncbi:hypothetical protein FKP32DRAFT_1560444 [Trametes sanguinea]|nr:hypothetical protein FKP32DRAFT_1560444 [Trametes sanguinea]
MHNLFLGELRHHCREVLGINVKDKSSESSKIAPHSPEEQRKWLEKVASHVRNGAEGALQKVRKGYIVAVAELNGALPASTSFAKQDYVKALLQWWNNTRGEILLPPVLVEATTDFRLTRDEYDISRFSVLDQDTVEQLRKDINSTTFPSWMERPPRNFGSPSHGKLKADMWRTVCTVSMVITLVRLWSTPGSSARTNALRDNFVHLVSAVDLASRRSTDQDRIDRFDHHMMEYLRSLRELFNHKLVPNHHLSLHLKECLELFGPVYAWWAFPFERYNGILQRLNTNSKSDEMPITFMRYFYLGGNVRSLMAETKWPDVAPFRAMQAAYEDAVRDAVRGTRLADFFPSNHLTGGGSEGLPAFTVDERQVAQLPRAVYDSLFRAIATIDGPVFAPILAGLEDRRPRLPDTAQQLPSIEHRGMTYTTCRSSRNNSLVMLRCHRDDDQDMPTPARIMNIFLHGRCVGGKSVVQPFVVVEEFVALTEDHATADPYRRYEDLQTRLYYNDTVPQTKVIPLDDILCHFASLVYKPEDIDKECIVVRSLDRVSITLLHPCYNGGLLSGYSPRW